MAGAIVGVKQVVNGLVGMGAGLANGVVGTDMVVVVVVSWGGKGAEELGKPSLLVLRKLAALEKVPQSKGLSLFSTELLLSEEQLLLKEAVLSNDWLLNERLLSELQLLNGRLSLLPLLAEIGSVAWYETIGETVRFSIAGSATIGLLHGDCFPSTSDPIGGSISCNTLT